MYIYVKFTCANELKRIYWDESEKRVVNRSAFHVCVTSPVLNFDLRVARYQKAAKMYLFFPYIGIFFCSSLFNKPIHYAQKVPMRKTRKKNTKMQASKSDVTKMRHGN